MLSFAGEHLLAIYIDGGFEIYIYIIRNSRADLQGGLTAGSEAHFVALKLSHVQTRAEHTHNSCLETLYTFGLPGMVLALAPEQAETAMEAIRKSGETSCVVGHVRAGEKGVTLC